MVVVAAQREELRGDELDAALVRLPIDSAGLHVIPLYQEIAVVVCSTESHLSAVDELERLLPTPGGYAITGGRGPRSSAHP